MKTRTFVAAVLFAAALPFTSCLAQAPSAAGASAPAWKYKSHRLSRDEIDGLLSRPEKVLFLDVRRPDELIRYGSFPAFLNVQNSELEKNLAYVPKDRTIVTVSNHAMRAGAAADILTARGFTVAGAVGSEDYEHEGGTAVRHIQAPVRRAAASAPAGL